MDNLEIRTLYNNLTDALNGSNVCAEGKRIVLELLAKECQIAANNEIITANSEMTTITEEGELKDAESVC